MKTKEERLSSIKDQIITLKTIHKEIVSNAEQSPVEIIQRFVDSLERVHKHISEEEQSNPD